MMAWGNRWEWEHTRKSTAGLLSLDVRRLNRQGALRPGVVCSVGWGKGQTIITRMNRTGDALTLDYTTRAYGQTEPTSHRQPVALDWTPCHYGGHRVWFACPGCGSRRAVLFSAGGVFRCRACHDLAYQSTRDDDIDRGTRRIRTLQGKLNAAPGCTPWHIPSKPAGMHWRTYDRLALELRAAIVKRNAMFGAALDTLQARVDAVLAREGGTAYEQPARRTE